MPLAQSVLIMEGSVVETNDWATAEGQNMQQLLFVCAVWQKRQKQNKGPKEMF